MLPSPTTVRKRIQYGRDREQAKTIPVQQKYTTDGMHESLTIKDIYRRCNNGRSLERAMSTPKLGHGGARNKKDYVLFDK